MRGRQDQGRGQGEAAAGGLSERALSHAVLPEHMGRIEQPDGYARITGSCGDTMEFFLLVRGGIVRDVAFTTDGCLSSVAAGNAAASMIKGKPLTRARAAAMEDILELLGGLPGEDEHCALLAASTIKAAAVDAERNEREPWRKLYRKL